MKRALPSFAAAISVLSTERPGALESAKKSSKKSAKDRQSKQNPINEEDTPLLDKDEVMQYQSDVAEVALRIKQTLRDMDGISLRGGDKFSSSSFTHSNQMQFIEDQCQRARAALPIEYYSRQLQYKQVARKIIEVDERVEYNNRTWRRALKDLDIDDRPEQPKQQKASKKFPASSDTSGDTTADIIPDEDTQEAQIAKEDAGYDSDDLTAVEKEIQSFMSVQSEGSPTKDSLNHKYHVFSEKALQTMRIAIINSRKLVLKQIASFNSTIHERENQLAQIKLQIDQMDSEIKEFILADQIVKEVVEGRFKGSMNQLNDHLLKQRQDLLDGEEVIKKLTTQKVKINNMTEEIRLKRNKADPFIKKRANDLVKGLLAKLDDKDAQLQEDRETHIRDFYTQLMEFKQRKEEALRRLDVVDEFYESTAQDIITQTERITREKITFKDKAQALKLVDEEMTNKLQRIESTMAEYARAERRRTHLEAKRLGTGNSTKTGLMGPETMSTEGFIAALDQKFTSSRNPSMSVRVDYSSDDESDSDRRDDSDERDFIEVKDTKKKSRESTPGHPLTSSSKLQPETEECDPEEALDSQAANNNKKKKTYKDERPQPLQLVDDDTEALLGINTNENLRQTMTKQPLSKPTTVEEALRLSPEFYQIGSPPSPAKFDSFPQPEKIVDPSIRFTPLMLLEDSDTDLDHSNKVDDALTPFSLRHTAINARTNRKSARKAKPTSSTAVTDAALMPVTSSICTASYVKLFQDFTRRGPLANSSNSNTPRTSSFLRQQSFTFQQSPKGVLTRGGSRRASSRGGGSQFESFQFDLDEGIKVVMEALDRLRLRECIDNTKAVSLRQDLIALAAVIQLQALTDESRSAQFKLHKLCQSMLVATMETAPKALLVSNTRSLFAEVLSSLFAILGVIFNCSLSFWEPAARAALSGVNIPFVEQLSKQLIETVLAYGNSSKSAQEQRKKQIKMVDFHALVELEDEQDDHHHAHESEEEINPFLLIATIVGVLQRSFTTCNPDRVIAPLVETTLEKLDSLFPDMSLISFLHQNQDDQDGGGDQEGDGEGESKKKQSRKVSSSVYSPTFETPHRNSLGIMSAFLLSVFSTQDLSAMELKQTFDIVQREGEEIGIVKSSYSMPQPLLNLTDLDDLLSSLCFPQILPAVLSLELLKRCIDEDLSRRLFLQRVAEQDRSVAELQYLNVDMPVTVEFHMQTLNRMDSTIANNTKNQAIERGNSEIVRPAAASRSFRLKSTAEKINELQTTDEHKPQPVPPLGTRESFLAVQRKSLLPAIFKRESSSIVSPSYDGISRMGSIRNSVLVFDSNEVIAKENEHRDPAQLVAEAIARLRLQQEQKQPSPPRTGMTRVDEGVDGITTIPVSMESTRQHSSSKDQSRNKFKVNTTPTTTMDMQELHERWLDEREKYVIHLCQQIHDMVWFAPSASMSAEETTGEQERHLPLPEPLVFKLLAHIEKVRKIIHARSADGAVLMRATEHEFRQVVIELRIVQRKILRVINAMTLPMRRRLLWLQDKFSKVNDENGSSIKFIEETTKKADRIRKDSDDLCKSLKIIQTEKAQPGFKGAVNLLKHSLEVQRMILQHATEEVSERVKHLKDRESGLQEILDGMIAEYGKLVGQEVSLQNAQKDMILQPAFQSARYRQQQQADGAMSSDDENMSFGYSLTGSMMTSLSMQSSSESKMLLDTPVDEILSFYSNQASSHQASKKNKTKRGQVSFFSDEEDDSIKITSSRDTFTLSGRHLRNRTTDGIPYNQSSSSSSPQKSHQRLTHRWQQLMNNSQRARRYYEDKEKQRKVTSEESPTNAAAIPQKIFGFGKRIDRGLHDIEEEKRSELQARINKEKLVKQKSIQSNKEDQDDSMSSAPAIFSTDWKDGRYHTAHIIPTVSFESRGQKVAVYNQDQLTHRTRHFFHRAFQLPKLNPFIRYDHSHDEDGEGGGQLAWEGIFTPLNLRKLLQIQQKMTKLASTTSLPAPGDQTQAQAQADTSSATATAVDTAAAAEQQQAEPVITIMSSPTTATLKRLSISFGSENSNQRSRVIKRRNTLMQHLVDQHGSPDESRRGSLVFPNHPPMLGHQVMITPRMKRGKHMTGDDHNHAHDEVEVAVMDDETTAKPLHADDAPDDDSDNAKHAKLLSTIQPKVEPGSKAAYDQWQERQMQRSLANHRRNAHIASQQHDSNEQELDEAVQDSEGYRTLRRYAHENLDRSIQSLIFSVMNPRAADKSSPMKASSSTRRVTRRRAASPLAFGSLSTAQSASASGSGKRRRVLGIHEHHQQHESKQREQMLADEQAWQNEILSYLGDNTNGTIDVMEIDLLAIPRDETFADQTYAGAFKGDLVGEGMLASVQEMKKQFPQAFQPSSKESVGSIKKPSTGASRAVSVEFVAAEDSEVFPKTSNSDRGSTTDSVRVAQSSSRTTPMILARLNESNVIPPPFFDSTYSRGFGQSSTMETSAVAAASTAAGAGISYLPWNTAKLASAISMRRTNEMSAIVPLIGVKQLSKRRNSLLKRAESMMQEIDALQSPRRPSEAKPSRDMSMMSRRNTVMKFDDEDV